MITVSAKALEKFKKICKERMGIELDDVTAREQALKLLHLVALTRRPLPSKTNDSSPGK